MREHRARFWKSPGKGRWGMNGARGSLTAKVDPRPPPLKDLGRGDGIPLAAERGTKAVAERPPSPAPSKAVCICIITKGKFLDSLYFIIQGSQESEQICK